MSERRSIENFFEDIDADLARYAAEFRRNGFTSDKTMKYWREEDFNTLTVDVPPGHRRLILNMVSKLRTPEMKPHKRKLSPKKDYAQETLTGAPRSKRNILSVVESKVEAHKRALSPVERFIKIKEEELTSKNDEIAEKKRELDEWLENIENVATINRKSTGTKCSNCHLRNHTVRTCVGEKCSSAFLCGDLAKHSDEKLAFQEKKRAISALEASAKISAYSRVSNSVNKRFSDMLVEDFPDKYTNNLGVKNWLKIQQDVSAIKKHFPEKSLPSRQTVKAFIEQKHDNLFVPQKRVFSTTTTCTSTCTSTNPRDKQLSSYGIKIPQKKYSTLANEPTSEQEEEEQIKMATQLSLLDDSSDTHSTQAKVENDMESKAANILLSLNNNGHSRLQYLI